MRVGHGSSPNWPSLRPKGRRRMGANPHANGGLLLKDLRAARLPRLSCRRRDESAWSVPRSPRRHASMGRLP